MVLYPLYHYIVVLSRRAGAMNNAKRREEDATRQDVMKANSFLTERRAN